MFLLSTEPVWSSPVSLDAGAVTMMIICATESILGDVNDCRRKG